VRLVAVLGYSRRGSDGLHAVCAARLRHAERLTADAVLLSGRELGRVSWNGSDLPCVSDTAARNTRQNAEGVAEAARRLGASEVVVVTSRWHAPRARTLVRAALRDPRVPVRSSSPPGRLPLPLLAREIACLAVLPYHLLRLRAR
jgi:hypothetical protein